MWTGLGVTSGLVDDTSTKPFFCVEERRETKESTMHRGFESERHAFQRLGLSDPHVSEGELVREFEGRVPEGIFMTGAKVLSVEVKRIVGNSLPKDAGGRRRITRMVDGRERIVWPWTSSVETALSKLSYAIAQRYKVCEHHAVFLIPRSLPPAVKQRTVQHITSVADHYLGTHSFHRKVRYHIFETEDCFFDRF